MPRNILWSPSSWIMGIKDRPVHRTCQLMRENNHLDLFTMGFLASKTEMELNLTERV